MSAGPAMFSAAGDREVVLAVSRIMGACRAGSTSRRALPGILAARLNQIAKKHPEVHDTEPETWVVEKVNEYLDELGWVHITRDDLI